MGDMADLYDYWDDNPYEEDELIERIKNKVWQTADGEEIKISDMRTSHLGNAIGWIERNTLGEDYMREYIELFNAELASRA